MHFLKNEIVPVGGVVHIFIVRHVHGCGNP